ncbi:MAG: Transcriptional regulator, TraR/DksA family [Candidatus Woesebacteria bacterium GW2011_GWA1_45_8]|uniref:Transcriptional regulator, TraR/DksA family n=1 Tax=Candidatus Woesebacteria bacterium GW2011_GWA1_45_8 TaxID=1618559 RepID=A0A0G1MV18_9BACT|nr:MAG: Transcriptional regulator, TraR/DksA family [Candidatus Woesebacteria bacterium GW2011_GWA1_45_8]
MKKVQSKKTKAQRRSVLTIPSRLLAPVGAFLQGRLRSLQDRKKTIEKEDPFKDTTRILDNASPDTDAAEQFGHARASAIRKQIGRSIIQTRKALARLRIGKYGICEDCGRMIDTDRLMVYPDATLCAEDAAKRER